MSVTYLEAEIQRVKASIEDVEDKLQSLSPSSATFEQDQDFYRQKELQLRREMLQLRQEERQLRQEELVLLRAREPGPPDYLERLRRLLKQGGIDRPHEATLALIVRHLSSRLIVASTVDTAMELYQEAKTLPGPSTEAQLLKQTGLRLNGPLVLESGACTMSALYAMDAFGRPRVLKLLRPALANAGGSEASGEVGGSEAVACRELCCGKPEDVPLVDAEVITFMLGPEHSATAFHGPGVYAAVVMPEYSDALTDLPPMPLRALLTGARRMAAALDWIHDKGFVHMDVKADNIFVDEEGRWWLGDFGSAVRVGTPIISTTRCFAPPAAQGAAPAAPHFDWHMLAVAMVMEVLRSVGMGRQWRDLLVSKDLGCTPRENILAALDLLCGRQIDDDAGELLGYLRELVERAQA